MDALAASPFALLDAHSSLRLVTDAVHDTNPRIYRGHLYGGAAAQNAA